jgi:hypothetical protein
MRNKTSRWLILAVASLMLVVLVGCEADNPASIFEESAKGLAAPEIASISPADSTLAGIGEIILTGKGFSPIPEENYVFFNKERVVVTEASATQLKMKSPVTPMNPLIIKVAHRDAYVFSNQINYKLLEVFWEWGGFDEYDNIYGMDLDKNENLYVAGDKVIDKVTPDGVRIKRFGTMTFPRASGIKMGPGGVLYIARNSNLLYTMPPTGGAAVKWVTAPGKVYDFDFSESGAVYAGGKNEDLYRILPSGVGAAIAAYADVYIKAVRVFNGYVYVGGAVNSTSHDYVWRQQIISDDQLGEKEVYFDWSGTIDQASEVLAITFSADGDMYIGTNAPEAIIVVHPDGSYDELYPGVIFPESYAIAWGNGPYLYINRRNDADVTQQRVIKLNMQKLGAPYFGRI